MTSTQNKLLRYDTIRLKWKTAFKLPIDSKYGNAGKIFVSVLSIISSKLVRNHIR
jgi:hypothetical protein